MAKVMQAHLPKIFASNVFLTVKLYSYLLQIPLGMLSAYENIFRTLKSWILQCRHIAHIEASHVKLAMCLGNMSPNFRGNENNPIFLKFFSSSFLKKRYLKGLYGKELINVFKEKCATLIKKGYANIEHFTIS